MSQSGTSGSVVVAALAGLINIGFGALVWIGTLPELLNKEIATPLGIVSGILLLIAAGLIMSSPPQGRGRGGILAIIGSLIGAINPLSLILGLIAGYGAYQESKRAQE